jgi:hypothetical protein
MRKAYDIHRRAVLAALLTLRHSRSTNTLSRQAPLPSMLMAMTFLRSTPLNAEPVNWLPWPAVGTPRCAAAAAYLARANSA